MIKRIQSRGKIVSSMNVALKTEQLHVKEWIGTLSHII